MKSCFSALFCMTLGFASTASANPLDFFRKTENLGGNRPAKLEMPRNAKTPASTPLVVFLHGYSSNAGQMDLLLGLSRNRNKYGYAVLLPEGTKDKSDNQFWKATDFCCGDAESRAKVDDVAYLSELIEEALEKNPQLNPEQVYLFGHSNGGFMGYTLACERPDLVKKVVSIAGLSYPDFSQCKNPMPGTSVLHIHGQKDTTIPYDGATGRYTSAPELARSWAGVSGCEMEPTVSPRLDLTVLNFGKDTDVLDWKNCEGGAKVSLWTIPKGSHLPLFTGGFLPAVWNFLKAE